MPITYKSAQFTVESYTVSVNQNTDGPRRILTFVSPDLSHGIRYKALILFYKQNFGLSGVGHANNLNGANFDPRSVTAWGDSSLFDSFYAVLSSEAPVTFSFDYQEDSATPNEDQKLITGYRLFTGTEAPGDFEKALV